MKIAAPALGALLIALSLLVPVAPKPASRGPVEEVKLQPSPGDDQRAAAGLGTVTHDRRSRRDDLRPRRAAKAKGSPNAQSISRAGAVRGPDATPQSRLPTAGSPTGQPRNDSAPRANSSPAPRPIPVGVNTPGPDHPSPRRDPASVPSEPADPPDPDATTAGAEPPDEPESADAPDSDATTAGADPPDEPEPAGGEPLDDAP